MARNFAITLAILYSMFSFFEIFESDKIEIYKDLVINQELWLIVNGSIGMIISILIILTIGTKLLFFHAKSVYKIYCKLLILLNIFSFVWNYIGFVSYVFDREIYEISNKMDIILIITLLFEILLFFTICFTFGCERKKNN